MASAVSQLQFVCSGGAAAVEGRSLRWLEPGGEEGGTVPTEVERRREERVVFTMVTVDAEVDDFRERSFGLLLLPGRSFSFFFRRWEVDSRDDDAMLSRRS